MVTSVKKLVMRASAWEQKLLVQVAPVGYAGLVEKVGH